MRKIKTILNITFLLCISIYSHNKVHAKSDGKGTYYIKNNVGIKTKNPQAQLHVNGSFLMKDGNQSEDYVLRSDNNGKASWVDVTTIPGVIGDGGQLNNTYINNGDFFNATLLGTTTINGNFYFPGSIPAGYILIMQANGNAHWGANILPMGTENGEWNEIGGIIYPAQNDGAQNVAIGSQDINTADIILYKNGGAIFNQQQDANGDFIVSGTLAKNLLLIDSSSNRIAVNHSSPDTVLDINGQLSIRAGTNGSLSSSNDYESSPDLDSAVIWLAKNSSYANNGDLVARINSDGEDKIFKLIDFDGTTDGVTTQNGLILTDLTANRLIKTDANKQLTSETTLFSNGSKVGIGNSNPTSLLEVGNAVKTYIDGNYDLLVEGDVEVDGTVYGLNFVGNGSSLSLNGNTIRNAKIYNSTFYEALDFNGNSMIRAESAPILINGDTELGGNLVMQPGYIMNLFKGDLGSEESFFYAYNGDIGINTINPQANLEINGSLLIRTGSPLNGYVLTSDANGLATWQPAIALEAINAENATYAEIAYALNNNATILNGNIIGGILNGLTLKNISIENGIGLSNWDEGIDGLYPNTNTANQNVLIGGNTINNATIKLEANGSITAEKFYGNAMTLNSELWINAEEFLYPYDTSKSVLIGGNTINDAAIVLKASGSVEINKQKNDADLKISGQAQENLFYIDASKDGIGINTNSPRTSLDINGSFAFLPHSFEINTSGIGANIINKNSIIYLSNENQSCSLDITNDPQIAAGQDGQIITIVGLYSNEAILLEDGAGLALNNNVSFKLKAKDSITFIYSNQFNEWVELSRNNYLERSGEEITRGVCQ